MEKNINLAPIGIEEMHDILFYAFNYFKEYQTNFKEYFEKNYSLKKFEVEDLQKQKIVFEDLHLKNNYEYLAKNDFICDTKGITNKGIKALMKMDLIQYSQEQNKSIKKWIALLDKE